MVCWLTGAHGNKQLHTHVHTELMINRDFIGWHDSSWWRTDRVWGLGTLPCECEFGAEVWRVSGRARVWVVGWRGWAMEARLGEKDRHKHRPRSGPRRCEVFPANMCLLDTNDGCLIASVLCLYSFSLLGWKWFKDLLIGSISKCQCQCYYQQYYYS